MLTWIPLFPLVGFLINGIWYGLFQTKTGAKKAHSLSTGLIATICIALSFILSVKVFLDLKDLPENARFLEQTAFNWIHITGFDLIAKLRVDPLNALFLLLITGVGTLIHIYSIGYMSHDATPGKFFSYLNLFCFAMLVLVLGASLPMLFFGWEGVGLCSYLLIGYWYNDPEKASAGKKAFIVNRVGDFGFLIGMFFIYSSFGTLDFTELKTLFVQAQGQIPLGVTAATLTTICMLLFVGCMGKSAQIPLYIWLPDAMAGPTPVSALIHAATMVTSGVYMVSRLNFMYSLSHEAMFFMAVVGAFTAFFAATVAFAQKDIKKVLAYSTVSQLGFMFLGCGVGAYSAGVFHVITHGFFKALLFLAAGSVIHGMHEEQDITKMGGLKSLMPKTHMVFMLAWLAICGVIPFSGFFSKDEILWKAFSSQHGSILLWVVGFATALMTATYMTRLYTLTFLGKHRSKNIGHGTSKVVQHKKDHHTQDDHHQESHSGVHESPAVMIVPLQILALLSVIGGFMGVPHLSWIDHWLEPVIPSDHGVRDGIAPSLEWVLMTLSVVLVPLVLMWARKLYINFKDQDPLEVKLPGLYKTLENKWYVDEFFTNTIIKPIHTLSIALWQGFDVAVIDRVVLGLGRVSMWSGQAMRIVQTGSLQFYAFILLSGVAITVGYFIYGIH